MVKKIALEEHFMAPGMDVYEKNVSANMVAGVYENFSRRLVEFDKERLQIMDSCGIEICVLSQTTPGLQAERQKKTASKKARNVNDFLASVIDKNPDRFKGFAHLALQEPQDASRELTRCVEQHGFVGALINGHTNGTYLDHESYLPFWECVASLDVPIYLHPADPFDNPWMLKDHQDLLGPMWAWTMETATHALRLISSGLFDRYPTLKIILGHMGETLPFLLWRLDSRWAIGVHQHELSMKPSEYIRRNFYVTTSGACDFDALACTISAMGIDKVMFSVDYPFESSEVAATFADTLPLPESDIGAICFNNAKRLLKI